MAVLYQLSYVGLGSHRSAEEVRDADCRCVGMVACAGGLNTCSGGYEANVGSHGSVCG
jgi:hypothetical protein